MRSTLLLTFLLLFGTNLIAQNGKLDNIGDLFTKETRFITTPDGASLATDIYLPITSDSLVIEIDIDGVGSGNVELIQKGIQYIYYPTLNDSINPNPYQLPTIFTRTTYDKEPMSILGYAFALFGYASVIQDSRGSHGSNDVWMPLYTDGWEKTPYTDYVPQSVLPEGYTGNPSLYEDGQVTLDWILDAWKRNYDIDDDGIVDFQDDGSNGSIFYFGASALANSGLFMALTEKTDPNAAGLKGFLNLIASSEHYSHTFYENGMFKQGLLKSWLRGEINDYREDIDGTDTSYLNFIHTYSDFGSETLDDVLNKFLDLITIEEVEGSTAYYPNNPIRAAFDASVAYTDEIGNGDATGAYSRYENLDMPVYNVAGWWDIFLEGQISTWQNSVAAMQEKSSANVKQQKLIIGPWQHYYPAVQTAGDLIFPNNVGDVLGVTANIEGNNQEIIESLLNLNLQDFLNSELISFISSSTNYNSFKNIGAPRIRFPKNETFQKLLGDIHIQIPAEDYEISHADLINFLGGESSLEFFPASLYIELFNEMIPLGDLNLSIPPIPDFITDIFGGISEIESFPPFEDFSAIPNVRYYICGPINDGISANRHTGNYWASSDTFPITEDIIKNTLFLHSNNTLSAAAPYEEEEKITYTHDPDNPVRTVGGNNLGINTPNGDNSMGPLNLANPVYDSVTMTRPDVVSFTTNTFQDSVQIIGNIQAKLYASSLPEGSNNGDPTDTDFVVRLVDVYPNGKEFLITEGNINARARKYVKSLAENAEDINASFSNIEANEVYEYHFSFIPCAYTFGKEHKLKILVSSSNYPRFQSNPNIPIEENGFFRREPGDNITYNFQGIEYTARKASNSIHFSPEYPSQIILPLKGRTIANCKAPDSLFVTEVSDSSIQLNWLGGEATTQYLLEYRAVEDTNWTSITLPQTFYIVDDLEVNENYIWQIKSLCNDTTFVSRVDTFSVNITSLNTNYKDLFKIYPNPVKDILYLKNKKNSQLNFAVLYNANGTRLQEFDLSSNQSLYTFDLSSYEAGTYFIELHQVTDNQKTTIPIIILDK